MDVVIDFEILNGRQIEILVKELYVATKIVTDSFRFKIPYSMKSHGSEENGLKWEDGHIAYHDFYTVVSEAVPRFVHLYSYGVKKCLFLSEM